MKTILTSFILFAFCVLMNAQSIQLTNSDCSAGSTLTGTSPNFTLPGFAITATVATNFGASAVAASGIVDVGGNSKLKIYGTANGVQSDVKLTTEAVDVSAYTATASVDTPAKFAYSCKLYLGTAASTATPYTVGVTAFKADGTVYSTGITTTLVKPNVNVPAGTVVNPGATIVITDPLIAKLSFVVQVGKMFNFTLYFDDFTLTATNSSMNVGTPTTTNLSYEVGKGPSVESTFTVSGSNLGADAFTLTPGSNMEISLTTGFGFVAAPTTLTLNPDLYGNVAGTTIYARLKAGVSLGIPGASGTKVTVAHATAGSSTIQYTCSVNGVNTTNPASTALSYTYGSGPSAEQSFTVQGNALTDNLVVTPGSNMEISTTSGSGFASTPIAFTPASGVVAVNTIYVRLIAGLTAATYNDATTIITTSSTGYSSTEKQFVGTVDLGTGIQKNNLSSVKCIVDNGTIRINGVEAGKIIEIYNSVGQKINSVISTGNNAIQVAMKGIYVVKTETFEQKVLLK